MTKPAYVPVATYRLQFNKSFTFNDALEIVDYLRQLGVSDLYASPVSQAGPESAHGYDICDFNTISPSLGGMQRFRSLSDKLRNHGMGMLVDMVPNHMGNHQTNDRWRDVLQNGRQSQFANYFDINWDTPEPGLKDKALLPVLGDHYNHVLEQGELKIAWKDGKLLLTYYDSDFPLSGNSLTLIASSLAAYLEQNNESTLSNRVREAARNGAATSWDWLAKVSLKSDLVNAFLKELNGSPGKPESFNQLHAILEAQHYRLAFWRIGPEEINYRRFFDITQLVSMKMERQEVFEKSHQVIMDLVDAGAITGLRIDHPDGLWDPAGYFDQLQKRHNQGGKSGQLYVVAEKILSEDETLPNTWVVHGTTGYDYLNQLNGIFVRAESGKAFHDFYGEFTGAKDSMLQILLRAKKQLLNSSFISEKRALSRRLKLLASSCRIGKDLAQTKLETALEELLAYFPIYRTYVDERTNHLSDADARYLQHAFKNAGKAVDPLARAALQFLYEILSLQFPADFTSESISEAKIFIMKFQQLSGPLMAKGLEDTTFYRYFPFVSLNEVGGNPSEWGKSLEQFHAFNNQRAKDWPHSLSATATHDTKRGEDTRARMNVISEMPDLWQEQALRWSKSNMAYRQKGLPSPNDEYLLYQILAGVFPFQISSQELKSLAERVKAYMQKAIREAKVNTTWTDVNQEYEDAVAHFVEELLKENSDFLASFIPFQKKISYFGQFNSLSQTLLKIASPGVPDFYQGCELWDFSMVDPDNRRPVDYQLRQQMLVQINKASPINIRELLQNWQSGAVKMFVIAKALAARKQHAQIFTHGSYKPVAVDGLYKDHICAFARTWNGRSIVVAAPRFIYTLVEGEEKLPVGSIWGDCSLRLPAIENQGRFRNVFTGDMISQSGADGSLKVADLFATFPLALLEPAD
ncbi:MAG: malto-oligosyltrehalose synthase [Verrucomicrobiales bacterium]